MDALRVIYETVCAMDNQDVAVEEYPDRLVKALAKSGYALVPVALPYEVLGDAAINGFNDTGNPKHLWDYLLCRVRVIREPNTPMSSLPSEQASASLPPIKETP